MGATPMDGEGEGSITVFLGLLKAGDRAAAQPLWDAYFHRLVALARSRLRGTLRGMADEEDVALSAFDSFCRRAERGDFPQLADHDDLWQLLFVLTVRKAIGLARYQGRARRGGGRVAALEDLAGWDLDEVLGREPAPELAAQMADECRRLLDRLDDEMLRAVALGKMQGETTAAIAARLGCVEHTVERKLRSIRRLWSGEVRP
jgi:DNA-directed RNA polymerase specialized sigma24 family protein